MKGIKRDLSVLTDKDWEGIEKWLSYKDKKKICPFRPLEGIKTGLKCKAVFPGLQTVCYRNCNFACPCMQFSLDYVIKTAKKILKERR